MNKTYYVKTEEKEHTVKIQNKDEKFYEYDAELVKNPTGTLVEKTITENGEYLPASDNADGYSKVTVSVQSGGQQPTLYPPIITVGINIISWTNDTRNGGFAVTLSATVDDVAVTSPLTITEEMDGKTLVVMASAENFESATNEKKMHYIGATTHVIGEFPEIADDGGTYRFRVAAPRDSYTRWTIDGVNVHNSAKLPNFDPSDIRDYEVKSGGIFSFTATITNDTSQPSGFPIRFAGTGYFVNGAKVADLVFTGVVEIYDAETGTMLVKSNYTNNVGLPIPMDSSLARKTIIIKMNGNITLRAI